MKALVFLLFAFGFSALFAFNTAKWMARREAMTDDAVRLRAAYSNVVGRIDTPSEGIVIPLETNPDGSVRTSVHAAKAQFFSDSPIIWAEKLEMRKFDPDGTERLRLEAGSCVIDRLSRSGWVEGHAKVTQGQTVFEGEGVYFSATNAFVSVYSGADLKSADLKFGGVR